VLGSFGKADGLYTGGRADYPAMEQLLSELIPLAAQRAGGVTWEYYFRFEGRAPPWTSAMSQATGLEALTRAYEAAGNRYYLDVAGQALPVFSAKPPLGVSVKTALRLRYLQYTFAPPVAIINAFLQTLIGLDDYARVSGDQRAAQLFAAGNAEALQQLTLSGRVRRKITLRFRLSKYSRVGIVLTQGTTTKFLTSAGFPYGVDHFTIPALKSAGTYGVRLAAADLAGNFAAITGTLRVGAERRHRVATPLPQPPAKRGGYALAAARPRPGS
jgi:hypothetical protein